MISGNGKTSGETPQARIEGAECRLYSQGICRSCGLLGLPSGARLASKERSILETLAASGICPSNVEQICLPDTPWGSRSKTKLLVGGTADKPLLGVVSQSLKFTELAQCPLSPGPVRDLLEEVRRLIPLASLVPYSIRERRGELKGLTVMTNSPLSGGILRFVLRSTESVPRIRKIIPALQASHPWLSVVSCNIQPLAAAIPEGPEEVILTAQDHIVAEYGPVRLFLSPQSFMQVTPEVAAALYGCARSWTAEKRGGKALDLFCGVGGFALAVAPHVDSVTGIEASAVAVRNASMAAAEAGLGSSADFVVGDAERALDTSPDGLALAIVNPPRRGLSSALRSRLAAAGPERILYSSCNPETFARDVADLAAGYSLSRLAPFDMFPLTGHCELLGLLERR